MMNQKIFPKTEKEKERLCQNGMYGFDEDGNTIYQRDDVIIFIESAEDKKRVLDEYEKRRKKGILRTHYTHGEPKLTTEELDAIQATNKNSSDEIKKDPYENGLFSRICGLIQVQEGLPSCEVGRF